MQQFMDRMFDLRADIEDMDARGIDMRVVSASTVPQGPSFEPASRTADNAIARPFWPTIASWRRATP